MDPSIDKAEEFLKSFGFECEREPSWVTEGRKPDLYCQGSVPMWVEVKTLEETPEEERLAFLVKEFQKRTQNILAQWSAWAMISEEATEKDIKVVLGLAQGIFTHLDSTQQNYHRAFAIVPREPVYGNPIRLTVEAEEDTVLLVCCESRSARYEFPYTLEPRSWEEPVLITYQDGRQESIPFFNLQGSGDPLIALELTPGADQFHMEGWELFGGDWKLRNIERLRKRITEANTQLRNGRKYRAAPSVVLVYQDHVLAPADIAVIAALYGDLTYTFHREDPDAGYSSYHLNGVFGPEKNTSVSALCIVRNNAIPFTVHNQWAKLPLPQGLLGGREVIPKDDGSFEFVDY